MELTNFKTELQAISSRIIKTQSGDICLKAINLGNRDGLIEILQKSGNIKGTKIQQIRNLSFYDEDANFINVRNLTNEQQIEILDAVADAIGIDRYKPLSNEIRLKVISNAKFYLANKYKDDLYINDSFVLYRRNGKSDIDLIAANGSVRISSNKNYVKSPDVCLNTITELKIDLEKRFESENFNLSNHINYLMRDFSSLYLYEKKLRYRLPNGFGSFIILNSEGGTYLLGDRTIVDSKQKYERLRNQITIIEKNMSNMKNELGGN